MFKSNVLLASILVFSSSAYAAAKADKAPSKVGEKEVSTLETTGFKIKDETGNSMTLNFRDQKEVIISKEKFLHHEQAQNFCKDQKSKLDTDDMALVLAMSGAATENPFIESSVTFKFEDPSNQKNKVSGLMYWSGKGDEVVVMLDGRGTDSEVIPVSQFDKRMTPKVSAICSKDIVTLKKEIKKVDVGLSKVNASSTDTSSSIVDTSRNLKKEAAPAEKVDSSKATMSTAK